jgi:hypothetical protein
MGRANVVLLSLAVSMLLGMNANASGAASESPSTPHEAVDNSSAVQTQAMNLPLLVYVDARGTVRDIQHAQRLPGPVNDLLWQSVQNWTKSSAVVNGKHVAAQVLMNVTLHTDPRAGGKSNVYFTLASEGPVLHGYWILHGNRLTGRCTLSGEMTGGVGGKTRWCTSELIPGPTLTEVESPNK